MKTKSFLICLIILLCNYNKATKKVRLRDTKVNLRDTIISDEAGSWCKKFLSNEFRNIKDILAFMLNNISVPEKNIILLIAIIGTIAPTFFSFISLIKDEKLNNNEAVKNLQKSLKQKIFITYFTSTVDYGLWWTVFHCQVVSLWGSYFLLPWETQKKYLLLEVLAASAIAFYVDRSLKKTQLLEDVIKKVNEKKEGQEVITYMKIKTGYNKSVLEKVLSGKD